MRRLVLSDLGTRDYAEVLDLQRQLAEQRARGEGEDTLLIVEHPEVVTLGRTAQRATRDPAQELALVHRAGIPVVEIERGGAITWHGPGQLVGYPIVKLDAAERDVHRFLRELEGALGDALRAVSGLEAEPHGDDTPTGVWVRGKKIASIGIAVKRWVTLHGFALNVSNDLERFALFRPCDLEPRVMTSLAALSAPRDRGALVAAIHSALARRLGREAGARGREPKADGPHAAEG